MAPQQTLVRPSESRRSRPARRIRLAYTDVEWMAEARCTSVVDVTFFPEKGARAEPARRVCEGCGVRRECLAYALEHEIVDGVWGGCGPQELRTILRSGSATIDLRDPS